MHTPARARRATVAVIAALLLVMAWAAVGERLLPDQATTQSAAAVGTPEPRVSETFGSAEIEHAVIAAAPAAGRLAEPRLGPVWALAALAAALFTLSSLRRRHHRPAIVARPVLLRGSVARRAPPLASFA
jgi:hypothetical protein